MTDNIRTLEWQRDRYRQELERLLGWLEDNEGEGEWIKTQLTRLRETLGEP